MPGSRQPVIVFSHANGFPASTYGTLFAHWRAAGYTVLALEKFGHDPAFPVSSNWPHLRDQLVDFIAREAGQPAFLVGHSLGGLLSLLAASWKPELARGVVMLDSPLISGWRAHSLQVIKATGLMPRVSPGRVSRLRRNEWPSREAVREHYAKKALFARWDPRVFGDYIAHGIELHGDKAVLAFDRDVETHIFNTVPHHLDGVLRRHPLRCPVGFIAGTRSVEVRQGGLQASRRLAHERFLWVDGTHLYPMEHPDETAAKVLQLLAGMAPTPPL